MPSQGHALLFIPRPVKTLFRRVLQVCMFGVHPLYQEGRWSKGASVTERERERDRGERETASYEPFELERWSKGASVTQCEALGQLGQDKPASG